MFSFEFMGKTVELDKTLYYFPLFDYWVRVEQEKGLVTLGLTPTGNIKEGGYRSVEFTVSEGDEVFCGDVIAVAVTGKIKYLDTMISGRVAELNRDLEHNIDILQGSLSDGWLVRISTTDSGDIYRNLLDISDYCKALKRIESGSVPPGMKGAGSPTCRSVYEAIKTQKGK